MGEGEDGGEGEGGGGGTGEDGRGGGEGEKVEGKTLSNIAPRQLGALHHQTQFRTGRNRQYALTQYP